MHLLNLLFFASTCLACAQATYSANVSDTTIHSGISLLIEKSEVINSRVDSLQQKADNILNPDVSIDGIVRYLRERVPSPYSMKVVVLVDSVSLGVQHEMDSLSSVAAEYRRRLDSLTTLGAQLYQSKLSELEGRFDESPVPAMAQVIGRDPGDVTEKIPKADFPENPVRPLGVSEPVSSLNGPLDKLGSPQEQIDRLRSADEVQALQEKVTDANNIVDKIQAYEQDAVNIAQGNIEKVEQIPTAIENRLADMDEMKELQKYDGEVMGYEEMLARGNDPRAMVALASREVATYAIDHFAGKEPALKAAMEKMSAFGPRDFERPVRGSVPGRLLNQMKGKTFRERLVPGLSFQVQRSATFLLDLNPTLTWRLTGRLSIGGGWNERISFSDWNQVVEQDRVYGPRAFTSFGLGKGFSLKAEGERMNVFIPTFYGTMDGTREWVWGVFTGFKKDCRVHNRINGNVQVLYNLYDDHGNSPYLERLNVRMGFEIGLMKGGRRAGN